MAVTELPVVPESPAAGDHVYVLAPLALSTTDSPMQMGAGSAMVTLGWALTVISKVVGGEHCPADGVKV